ncbi:MAG: epoxyqueuosine reductase QueH [Bacteroidia bacterium]|nr:epoxyqueuosine reductase QueH [Bacteroidia bacterium]
MLQLKWPGSDTDKRVLLHACCAPCSSAILECLLQNGIRPTVFYYNPNIFPQEEYITRKEESKRQNDALGVEWIDGDYNHESWLSCVQGLEEEPERGGRCLSCFKMRMLASAKLAAERGIPYFTTTLASSRWKDIKQIETAALYAQEAVDNSTLFWTQNWRKGGLSERRIQLLKEGNFYNQLYCGCEFSMRNK